jgi:hypothetical protein
MTPLIFDRDEVAFQEWLARGRGYVINFSRQSRCRHGGPLGLGAQALGWMRSP